MSYRDRDRTFVFSGLLSLEEVTISAGIKDPICHVPPKNVHVGSINPPVEAVCVFQCLLITNVSKNVSKHRVTNVECQRGRAYKSVPVKSANVKSIGHIGTCSFKPSLCCRMTTAKHAAPGGAWDGASWRLAQHPTRSTLPSFAKTKGNRLKYDTNV